jgi:Curli production assembly/transport component CsgG
MNSSPSSFCLQFPGYPLKLRSRRAAALIFVLLLPLVPAAAAPPDILTVAIFDFESKDEPVRDLGPQIATLLNANLSAEPRIITVERAELEKVLGEQELGLSGTISPDTAARVGHLTGAKVLVTGRVFKVDKELVVVSKIIGTETSRVYGELVKGTSATPITDLAAGLAKKIAATITQKGDTLVAKVQTREERIARIKKSLPAGKLPAVSVKIPERHFGQPVIDPAAQTELALILKDCGFTLVDDQSPEKPDLEITGDAFSAFGPRKGNLISCKARVELKAQKRTGEILAVDRQTSVAVDITEQTAAKTALQNAAASLAERLLPKIAK